MAARVCEVEQNFLRVQNIIGTIEQMENVTNDQFNDVRTSTKSKNKLCFYFILGSCHLKEISNLPLFYADFSIFRFLIII